MPVNCCYFIKNNAGYARINGIVLARGLHGQLTNTDNAKRILYRAGNKKEL